MGIDEKKGMLLLQSQPVGFQNKEFKESGAALNFHVLDEEDRLLGLLFTHSMAQDLPETD